MPCKEGDRRDLCPVCGVFLNKHQKCDACGMLIGPGHINAVAKKRGSIILDEECDHRLKVKGVLKIDYLRLIVPNGKSGAMITYIPPRIRKKGE